MSMSGFQQPTEYQPARSAAVEPFESRTCTDTGGASLVPLLDPICTGTGAFNHRFASPPTCARSKDRPAVNSLEDLT